MAFKYLTLPLLCSLVSSAVISPDALAQNKPEKPAKILDVKPRVRAEAQRQQIRWGPITLPASSKGGNKGEHGHSVPVNPTSILAGKASMDPDGFAFSKTLDGGLCTDCTVLAAKLDVVFENGTRADISSGVYNHHVVSSLNGKKGQSWVETCPKGGSSDLSKLLPPGLNIDLSKLRNANGAGFVGGAVDEFTDFYTTQDGKFQSGYYVPPGIKASMSGELINYRKEPQNVYIQWDVEYVPGHVGTEAIKTAISVEGCNFAGTGSAFKKGTSGKVVSSDFEITQSGSILSFRGHTHDGTVSVSAFINNKLACESKAIYGLSGGELVVDGKEWKTISKMTECLEPYPVKKGDKMRLEASYDINLHPPRLSQGKEQENMAFMQMTLALDK